MKISANELAKVEQMLNAYKAQHGDVEIVREATNCSGSCAGYCSGGCNNFCTSGCRGKCDGSSGFCWSSR